MAVRSPTREGKNSLVKSFNARKRPEAWEALSEGRFWSMLKPFWCACSADGVNTGNWWRAWRVFQAGHDLPSWEGSDRRGSGQELSQPKKIVLMGGAG